jgi:hypothetical protein
VLLIFGGFSPISLTRNCEAARLPFGHCARLLLRLPLLPAYPESPVWDFGAVGSLHCRDLHDDAR